MITNHSTEIRVRYAETDQMGYVYYGNYATYYEVARVDLFRNLGTNYKEIEESGVWMPVSKMEIKYIKPAKYDDLLRIETSIEEMPTVRVKFQYKIYNAENELLNLGMVELAFIDSKTGRICKAPKKLIHLLNK